MKTSIVIATYNGAQKIGTLLDSIHFQTTQADEIIVVIDGSTDATESIIKCQENKFSDLRIIRQHNKGRSGARNTGAKNAKGDLLIFYDDDMQPNEDSIFMHIRHHQLHPNGILIGTQTDNPTLEGEVQRYKRSRSEFWEKALPQYPVPLDFDYLSAAHFSIRSKDLKKLNGFDETLSDAEDRELAIRARKAGFPIIYQSQNIAYHNDKITAASYVKRLRQYNQANRLVEQMHALPSSFRKNSTIRLIIYSILSWPILLMVIDRLNFLKIFPAILRYKIYDVVFTGLSIHFPDRRI